MERKYMMEFLMMGFIAMYIINGLKKMIDVRSKRRQITRNIVDFFENRYYAVTEEKNDYSSTSDNVAEKTMEKLNNRVYTDEENKSIWQYMLQLQEMGEKKEEYASLWKYMEGETEHRFPLYNYPDPGFRITEKYSHLSVVGNKSIC